MTFIKKGKVRIKFKMQDLVLSVVVLIQTA